MWGHRRRAGRQEPPCRVSPWGHICPGTAGTEQQGGDGGRNISPCHSEPGKQVLSGNTSTCCLHDCTSVSPGGVRCTRVAEVYQGRHLPPRAPTKAWHCPALSPGPARHTMASHGVPYLGMSCCCMPWHRMECVLYGMECVWHGMECVWHGKACPSMCLV